MVEAVRSHPDIINPGELMDKLPLLESVLFASPVDRVFLVVHAGETRAPVVTAALSKLAANGCDKVDLVLNHRTFPISPWIYKKL
jgi:hypothetical protein